MAASHTVNEGYEKNARESDCEEDSECAVCLQPYVLPIRLPCRHIFCFLCAKGLVLQGRPCALCRAEIPLSFINHPELLLLKTENAGKETSGDDQKSEKSYVWFYEGCNGWWQFETRINAELEAAYQRGESSHDALIAGSVYTLDFNKGVQQRRDDPSKRRRIKRDLASSSHKGVAGIRQQASYSAVPQPPHVQLAIHQHRQQLSQQELRHQQQPNQWPPPPAGRGLRVVTSRFGAELARDFSALRTFETSSQQQLRMHSIPAGPGLRVVTSRFGTGLTRDFSALRTSEPSSQQQLRMHSIPTSMQQPQHSTQLTWIPNSNRRMTVSPRIRHRLTLSHPVVTLHISSESEDDDIL